MNPYSNTKEEIFPFVYLHSHNVDQSLRKLTLGLISRKNIASCLFTLVPSDMSVLNIMWVFHIMSD